MRWTTWARPGAQAGETVVEPFAAVHAPAAPAVVETPVAEPVVEETACAGGEGARDRGVAQGAGGEEAGAGLAAKNEHAAAAGVLSVLSQADVLQERAKREEVTLLIAPTRAAGALDVAGDEGNTVLQRACLHGLCSVSGQLLVAGARPDLVNKDNKTAVDLARENPLKIDAGEYGGIGTAARQALATGSGISQESL